MDDRSILYIIEWVVELIEERLGQPLAWVVAVLLLLGIPVAAVAVAFWWYGL